MIPFFNKYKSLLLRSEFLKNAFTLLTGSTLSQIIPIFTAPIITRIYLPEYYGIMGIYMSISGLLVIISTLSYNSAILLPDEDTEAITIVHLCTLTTTAFTLIIGILVIVLHNWIAAIMHVPEASKYFLLLPVSIFAGGFGNTFQSWANRKKAYKAMSTSRVAAAILTAITSISLGFFWNGPMGLIFGLIINQLSIPLILFFMVLRKDPEIYKLPSRVQLYHQSKLFFNFPKFSLPTDFMNSFVNLLPIYMLSAYAGKNAVGQFNLSNRMLGLPISFISSSIGEVFKQRASSDYNKYGDCTHIFKKTLRVLTILSIIPFIVLILFAPNIFVFFFGEPWREAGVYTRILCLVYMLKFINAPLSYIIYIVQKQQWDLIMTLYWLVTSAVLLFIGLKFFNIYYALTMFSINYSMIYIYMIRLNYKFSKGKKNAF